ncbi:hypothetical protein GCM10011403_11870 [Pseudohongiella nitratireducens]|uniref:Proteophosphoglycan n=1 Tax=Pseudohongiella nitratireducens TaxID=1768907 RepID=A0A917GSZ7_9GAMM|nr:DUF1285 domain-containing protein [Pseudohongiella nitratireducens]MDF1622441.1 DUF1285 domain-containing protein [Pseudohongiella nitratireducens]GGG56378.1 hypothetical protein GCM10011403_11870 [Pseudohongiella nitratireducens]
MTKQASGTEHILSQIGQFKGPAPVHEWDPPYCGEMDMRIAADGRWYHEGSPIGRPQLVRLFSSILRKDPDGYHYLVTPAEKVRIQVDDCPFVAQLMDVEEVGGESQITFTLNTGETVTADANHAIEVTVDDDNQPHPTVHVRDGLWALISRSVFYSLVEVADQVSRDDGKKANNNNQIKTELVVSSSGSEFVLGTV